MRHSEPPGGRTAILARCSGKMTPVAASFSQIARHSAPRAAVLVAVLLLLGGPQALAQGWPAKTVRVIVPFSPGGTADTLGRLVSQKLSETLKENFVVENRGGAGGVIGSDLVAKAAPDGYTLLMVYVSHATNPTLNKTLPYDTLRDFS